MNIDFYRAFEDRYRGSRETIKKRLEVYIPFVEKIKTIHSSCEALDLGCGRGEWLELLQANGVAASGIDLDEGMLAECHNLGLDVNKCDLLSELISRKDNSLSIISGFHVVEHLDLEKLHQILFESLRVLRPGGIIILETPNAENLVVGTNNFYLDPTHKKPIPAMLLSFLTEYHGFVRNKTIRLQEDPELNQGVDIKLLNLLKGVSRDYAVIAQKKTKLEDMLAFDDIFNKNYGVSLVDVAKKYDSEMVEKFHKFDIQLDNAKQEIKNIRKHIDELILKNEVLESNLISTNRRMDAVLNSRSWRITAPIRYLNVYLKDVKKNFFLIKDNLFSLEKFNLLRKQFLINIVIKIKGNKFLFTLSKRILDRFPSIKDKLTPIYMMEGGQVGKVNGIDFEWFLNNYLNISSLDDKLLIGIKNSNVLNLNDLEAYFFKSCGLAINYKLIKCIRNDEVGDFLMPIEKSHQKFIESIVVHVYLALLRRYPSDLDVKNYSNIILNSQSIQSIIDPIKKSNEYILVGYRGIK